MLIIAERINATREPVARALRERDAALIARDASLQAEAGADFIDVNAGANPADEVEDLQWLVGVVQQATGRPLCIDTANPDALCAALEMIDTDEVMINSVTAESERMEAILPLAVQAQARLVALTMDDRGLPCTADRRVEIAGRLVAAAERAGLSRQKLYVDPCVQPVSTSPEQGRAVVAAVHRIMAEFPGVHTTCGLSNVSFGLPCRSLLNRTYLAGLVMAGLDSAILDPTETGVQQTILAAEALAGRDEFCMRYLRALR